MSIGKIAEMFKCSQRTIWAELCQYNIDARTKSETNKEKYRIKISKEALRDLYPNKKLDTNEIARKFNCSPTTIVKRLHRGNIPIKRIRMNISRNRLEHFYLSQKMTIIKLRKNLIVLK